MSKNVLKSTFSTLNPQKFADFLTEYKIPTSLNPQIPSKNITADDPPKGMVALYTKSFSIGNVRIPFTSFYLDVLSHFECHISQMHPLGAVKITNFEIVCNAFGKKPTVALFRMFYKLNPAGEWFTIERKGDVVPLVKARSGLKNWKDQFFWVSDSVVPKSMDSLLVWKPKGSPIADEFPDEEMYDVEFFRVLYDCRIVIRDHPEGILVLTNLSKNWGSLDYAPAIYNNNKEISLREYLIEEDHSSIKVSKKRKKTGTQAGEFGTGNAEEEIEETEEGLQKKKRKGIKKRVCDASSKKSKKIKALEVISPQTCAEEVLIPVEKVVAQQEIPRQSVANGSHIEGVSGTGNAEEEIEKTEEGLQKKRKGIKKHVRDASSKKSKKIKFLDAEKVLIPVEKAVAQQEIPRQIVTNDSHTEGVSGAETKHPEASTVNKRLKVQERQSDEAIDLDGAFGDLDNDSNFAEVQNGSDRVIPNRDVINEGLSRREFLGHVITPGRAQKIAKITNVELADKLEEIGGESLCFVSEGASRIRKLTKDVCFYRERLRKMENKAAKDAATIEQQAKTIGELTKLLTTSMENAREVRQKLEGEALESATKLKELANELKGHESGNAKVASDISDKDKVIAEKEKEIEGLKQKLVADETKDKEIAHLKEQLGDATEREKKLIKTQEALKKQNAQSVRSKDAALSSRRLVLSEVVPHVVKTLHHSHEFNAPLSKVKKLAVQLGRQQVIQEIQETKFPNVRLEDMEGYDGTIIGKFEEACKELEEADFPYIKEIAENTGRTVDDILKVEPKGPPIHTLRPCMINKFLMDGTIQRKVKVLAREYCVDIKRKTKSIMLFHYMLPCLFQVEEKMSKSDSSSGLFMEEEEIVIFTSYKELIADYEQGDLHPADFTPSNALNKILQPICYDLNHEEKPRLC